MQYSFGMKFLRFGAVQADQSRGYRIPEDFSIISLETTILSDLAPFTPDLIDIRAEEVASKAAELLIAKLENQPVEQSQILIPPKIITGTKRVMNIGKFYVPCITHGSVKF